jgi:hypothetical protein
MVGGKVFLVISYLHLFKQSNGMYVDFSTTFHLVLVPDFVDVLPVRVATP